MLLRGRLFSFQKKIYAMIKKQNGDCVCGMNELLARTFIFLYDLFVI